jgi:plasmid stability protein
MARIVISDLDKGTIDRLRARAARNDRSLQEEARAILTSVLSLEPATGQDVANAIRALFRPLGGVDLEIPAREPAREPAKPRR